MRKCLAIIVLLAFSVPASAQTTEPQAYAAIIAAANQKIATSSDYDSCAAGVTAVVKRHGKLVDGIAFCTGVATTKIEIDACLAATVCAQQANDSIRLDKLAEALVKYNEGIGYLNEALKAYAAGDWQTAWDRATASEYVLHVDVGFLLSQVSGGTQNANASIDQGWEILKIFFQ